MNLPQRMRDAANTLQELSTLYGYQHPNQADWSATELRHIAADIENATPKPWDGNCSGALADLGEGA
jgi:hypothetical protein